MVGPCPERYEDFFFFFFFFFYGSTALYGPGPPRFVEVL
jgi:hypothetical protein